MQEPPKKPELVVYVNPRKLQKQAVHNEAEPVVSPDTVARAWGLKAS